MARTTETIRRRHGPRDMGADEITETFTHRQQLPDGRVILADLVGGFWRVDGEPRFGGGWYVRAPKEWDETKAERLETGDPAAVSRRAFETNC